MIKQIEGFSKQLKPVTLDLNDLRWIEVKLNETEYVGKVEIFFHESIDIPSIEGLEDWSKTTGVRQLDSIFFEFGYFFINFRPDFTEIFFPSEEVSTLLLQVTLVPFIMSKQNRSKRRKTKILLTEKQVRKNILVDEKTPLWLTLLMFFMGGAVTKIGEMVIEYLKQYISR